MLISKLGRYFSVSPTRLFESCYSPKDFSDNGKEKSDKLDVDDEVIEDTESGTMKLFFYRNFHKFH